MSVFDLLNNKEYKTLIEDYNPAKPTSTDEDLIQSYKTPSSSYIKMSARGKNFHDVSADVLEYIINTCHQCSFEEKYRAILIILHMLYAQHKSEKNINDIRWGKE